MSSFKKLDNREWRSLQTDLSSFDHKGFPKKRAILDNSGRLVNLKEFLHLTGQRKMREISNFSKSTEEKNEVKKAYFQWKQTMRNFFGDNWKKVSKKLGYYNVPIDPEVRIEVKKEVLCLQ